jgi:hypothetical protein
LAELLNNSDVTVILSPNQLKVLNLFKIDEKVIGMVQDAILIFHSIRLEQMEV